MSSQLSQTPYFIRALWEWCTDSGLSPQIVVHVDQYVRVPQGFVADNRIVLDISGEATNQLELGNDWITFQARFGTKVENIEIPVGNVVAIFAEETSQGMAFDPQLLSEKDEADDLEQDVKPSDDSVEPTSVGGIESTAPAPSTTKASPLKIVK